MITCYIRYEIEPNKIAEFEKYARLWIPLVEKFGGQHHGYFLPHESANDIAVALFSFPTLSDYEKYRLDSMQDEECRQAFEFAKTTNCIRRNDRQFLKPLKMEQ